MVSEILSNGGYDPTTIIGGRLNRTENNAHLGSQHIMVAEADESDRSFLMLYPAIAIITNIDKEHMDNYSDFDDVKQCFADFANRVPFYGCNVVCLDDDSVADIIPQIAKRYISYGIKAQADVRGTNIHKDGFSVSFDVEHKGILLGRVTVNQPGDHIILNSLAAITVALELQVPFTSIAKALAEFQGVQRRMSVRYRNSDTIVIDDYGHHPTEIAATLKAVREALPGYRICAVFQPHRYSRTQSLMAEFAKCFMDADHLFVTDIFAASETPIDDVNTGTLIKAMKTHGFRDARYLEDWNELYPQLEDIGFDNTVVMTFGAGNITKLSFDIAGYLVNTRGEVKL
jgi:UDP-N-acetylmuramate--alanine ligase